MIKSPSRETLTTTTLIDHIATKNESNIVNSGVHETSLNDHYLIYCVRKSRGASKKQHKHISTGQMKNFDQTRFVNDLQEVDWKGIVQNTDDKDVVINNWTSIFSLILEKHAPIRGRRVSENFCPWLTSDFKVLCKARDKLKKQAIRSKSEVLMQSYMHIRNKAN